VGGGWVVVVVVIGPTFGSLDFCLNVPHLDHGRFEMSMWKWPRGSQLEMRLWTAPKIL
jgi:hypothetical protein